MADEKEEIAQEATSEDRVAQEEPVSNSKWDIEHAKQEIKRLREENKSRRLSEREAAKKVEELERQHADRLKALETELRLAKLAKIGIEGDDVDLVDFYVEKKKLSEQEAIEKVKGVKAPKQEADQPPAKKEIVPTPQGRTSTKTFTEEPTDFFSMTPSERAQLQQSNPILYEQLARKRTTVFNNRR